MKVKVYACPHKDRSTRVFVRETKEGRTKPWNCWLQIQSSRVNAAANAIMSRDGKHDGWFLFLVMRPDIHLMSARVLRITTVISIQKRNTHTKYTAWVWKTEEWSCFSVVRHHELINTLRNTGSFLFESWYCRLAGFFFSLLLYISLHSRKCEMLAIGSFKLG